MQLEYRCLIIIIIIIIFFLQSSCGSSACERSIHSLENLVNPSDQQNLVNPSGQENLVMTSPYECPSVHTNSEGGGKEPLVNDRIAMLLCQQTIAELI